MRNKKKEAEMNHFKRKAKYFKIYFMLFLLFLLITLMNTSTWNLCLSDVFSFKKNQCNQPKMSNQGGRNNKYGNYFEYIF